RGERAKALSSAAVGQACLRNASPWRRHPCVWRRGSRKLVRDLPWGRQWGADDRARHAAARNLRPEELCLPAPGFRRAGAHGAGGGTAGVRLSDRCDGKPYPDRVIGAEPDCIGGAVSAAQQGAGALKRNRARSLQLLIFVAQERNHATSIRPDSSRTTRTMRLNVESLT